MPVKSDPPVGMISTPHCISLFFFSHFFFSLLDLDKAAEPPTDKKMDLFMQRLKST